MNDTLKQKAARFLPLMVLIAAFIPRIIHNDAVMESPLYDHPVGGHTPYFTLAEQISSGVFVPVQPIYTLSSPGYPYVVAAIYKITHLHDFFALRMFTALLDSLTAVLIFLLARRLYNTRVALISSMIYAFTSPVIFFAVELTPVPFISFLLVFSFLLWTRPESSCKAASSFVLGLACTLRPNLILIFAFLWILAIVKQRERNLGKLLLWGGFGLAGILPITLVNHLQSGEFILLSTTGGQNLYIGHYEGSNAGYNLPTELDGDISLNMKERAEKDTGYEMSYSESSSYYVSKAVRNIMQNPYREINLLLLKTAAFFNAFEATNYADFYYQKTYSPILRYLPDFGYILAFLIFGFIFLCRDRDFLILIPVAVCLISVMVFFFISRLRMPCSAFIAMTSAVGLTRMIDLVRKKSAVKSIVAVAVFVGLFSLTFNWKHPVDTSNERNKEALVWQFLEQYEKAELGFKRAIMANPSNPQPYQNLAVMYNKLGRAAEARTLQLQIETIQSNLKSPRLD